MPRKDPQQLDHVRRKLGGLSGKKYWRALDELAETSEFREYLAREFPDTADRWDDGVSRREFLTLMAASLALAGLSGCTSDITNEKIVPYVRQPERIVPGKPLFFATAMPVSGFASGLLVESHMGRPTKVDGNPEHPSNLGASDSMAQASVLTLYDPDRAQTTNYRGQIKTWDLFLRDLQPRLQAQRAAKGAGLRILTETVTSPTLGSQLQRLLADYPEARWHIYDPIDQTNIHRGSQLAFDRAVTPIYDFGKADVILSLDADFMATGPARLRYAREFTSRRRPAAGSDPHGMSRLYAVESSPTLTGAKADHRLPLDPREILLLSQTIAARLGVAGIEAPNDASAAVPAEWLETLVDDLQNYRVSDGGSALVAVGMWQPPEIHALACAINQQLGAIGKTVRYIEPVEVSPPTGLHSLQQLSNDMQAGEVEMLFILGGNPVYTAPGDLLFSEAMLKVPYRVHHGLVRRRNFPAVRLACSRCALPGNLGRYPGV